MVSTGTRVTMRTQRSPKPTLGFAGALPFLRGRLAFAACSFFGLGRSRSPSRSAIAGSSVSASDTATVTAAAAASPMTVSTGMPATVRPVSAMTTVAPANTTALPAVARARDIDSAGECPSARLRRCRDRMKRA